MQTTPGAQLLSLLCSGSCARKRRIERMKLRQLRLFFLCGAFVVNLGLSAFASTESAKAVATAESWPMFRGNPGLTGISPAKLGNSLTLLWTYKTDGPVKSSAAIVGGKVFVGSLDKKLHCINLNSGEKIWTAPTEGEIESSPLALDGLVYVGSADGGLYAVDSATGKAKWIVKTDDKILGAPNWVTVGNSNWVIIGSYDYRLYCFDAKTGKTNWTYKTGYYINGSPAIAAGKTVFGGCDALLHVISLKDGQKLKQINIGAYIASSGAYEEDRIYAGHYDNEFFCADLERGAIKWKFKGRSFPYLSSPALTTDFVIFGGRDKRLHCVRKETGEEIWSAATRGKVDSSPVVVDNKVVVGSDDGNLYVFGLADGKRIWNYEIGDSITASPAVINGVVVIGSDDGSIYAFGESREKVRR